MEKVRTNNNNNQEKISIRKVNYPTWLVEEASFKDSIGDGGLYII